MKNKSHYLIKISKAIVEGYGGKVPHDFNELIKLPGVGRKTANVFLAEIDKRPAIAVDTHVNRVSYRLGLSSSIDNVLKPNMSLKLVLMKKIGLRFIMVYSLWGVINA